MPRRWAWSHRRRPGRIVYRGTLRTTRLRLNSAGRHTHLLPNTRLRSHSGSCRPWRGGIDSARGPCGSRRGSTGPGGRPCRCGLRTRYALRIRRRLTYRRGIPANAFLLGTDSGCTRTRTGRGHSIRGPSLRTRETRLGGTRIRGAGFASARTRRARSIVLNSSNRALS